MNWQRLAQAIVDRRVELGYRTRGAFVQVAGISLRVVADLETAGRSNYDPVTIARLERALEWPSGRVRQLLREGVEKLSTDPVGGHLLHPSGWEIPAEIAELIDLLWPDGGALDDGGRATVLQLLAAVRHAAVDISRRTRVAGFLPPASPGVPQA